MKVTASFDFAEIQDVSIMKVCIGQKFSLFHDYGFETEWAASNDHVLLIKDSGKKSVDVKSTATGKSTVLIIDPSLSYDDDNYILKRLVIEVVRAINPAVSLGITLSVQPKTL